MTDDRPPLNSSPVNAEINPGLDAGVNSAMNPGMNPAPDRPWDPLTWILGSLVILLYGPLVAHWYHGWLFHSIGLEHEYFSHGVVGLPVAGQLAWNRRKAWQRLDDRPPLGERAAGVGLLTGAMVLYLSPQKDLIHLSLGVALLGLCLTLKGRSGWQIMAFPWLLVALAIPTDWPYLLTPYTQPLQVFIAGVAGFLVSLLQVDVQVRDMYLFVGGRVVEVAPHCAGLKALLTNGYFGLMGVYFMGYHRHRPKAVILLLGALGVSVVANILRNTLLTLFHGTGQDDLFHWLHESWGGELYWALMVLALVGWFKGMIWFWQDNPNPGTGNAPSADTPRSEDPALEASPTPPIPAPNALSPGVSRSRILTPLAWAAIAILGAGTVFGAIPHYRAGQVSGAWLPPLPQTKVLQQIRQQGLDLPGWVTLSQEEITVGDRRWSQQILQKAPTPGEIPAPSPPSGQAPGNASASYPPGVADNPPPAPPGEVRTQAIVLLMPQKHGHDRPQVEWTDLQGSQNWTIDRRQSLDFAITPGAKPHITARWTRSWRPNPDGSLATFALLQWYAWPGGGHSSPNRWFWQDWHAQGDDRRVPWVAVCVMLPLEPLGDPAPLWPIAQSLGQAISQQLTPMLTAPPTS